MPLYSLGELQPEIDPSAFVHPDAVLIGAVRIAAEASVWPGAVLRADSNEIIIGARTSIQDGSVLHTSPQVATRVGNRCTIGHLVHLEGCTIDDRSLIGSGAVVLPGAHVASDVIVGANALVRAGSKIPPGALAVGVPVRIIEGGADPALIAHSEASYVARVAQYRADLRAL